MGITSLLLILSRRPRPVGSCSTTGLDLPGFYQPIHLHQRQQNTWDVYELG